MRLIQPVGSSVGKHKRRLTAMILTLSFAAAHVVSPAAEFAKAYAAENGQEVVLTEEAEPAGSSETPESPESSAPDEPVVSTPLAVTEQPVSVTVSEGETATFAVKASGEGLKYQWYYRKAGAKNWSVWKAHTTATTSAKANATWNLMKVFCKITDASGNSVSSNPAVITLRQPLTVLTQPTGISVNAGEKATFRVSAQGTGKLKYQWYYRKSGAKSGTLWKEHTSASTSAKANATWNGMKVWCVITDEAGQSVQSEAATVTITIPPQLAVLTQPKDMTVKSGTTAKFTVSAEGAGKISYQWYYRKSGADNWTLWKGHTSASTSVKTDDSWDFTQVYCRISDETGSTVDSDPAVIRIYQPLSVVSNPSDSTVSSGQTVQFAVKAQGMGKLSYQWYRRLSGESKWTKCKDQTSEVLSFKADATMNGMRVYCIITDNYGYVLHSSSAVLTVTSALRITGQPAQATVHSGETAKFSVKAEGSGLKYQWYYKKAGKSDWTLWKGQTSAVLSFKADATMNGMNVYCLVTDASGTAVNSSSAALTVVSAVKITAQPAQATVHSGETAKFSVKAEGSGLKYQWYYKKAGKSDWTLWKGQTSATASGVADCTWHVMQVFCRVTDSSGATADSKTAFAMITKKSSKRYIKRTIRVKSNTKVYAGPGTKYKALGTVKAGAKYSATSWDNDANDVTWYRFNWNGKTAWISRKKTSVSDQFVTVPDRNFKNGGVPVIYLSPSRQMHNAYAYGSTNEGAQMYRVGERLKKILEDEYLCVVYMPPVSMEITLGNRPTDAYNKEADVYLAIHSNANPSGKSYGAVGYYFPASAQSKKFAQNVTSEMGKIAPYKSTARSKTVNGMKAFDNMGYGEVRDPAYFGMVSLLAEVEYHDHADTAKWIVNNPDKIARALANSLEKTFGIQKKKK